MDAIIASVTVQHRLWGDARVDFLGDLLGYRNKYESVGRLTNLWGVCTALGTDTPPVERINACLGSTSGADALVQASLGERLASGVVRVKGTEGNIEWFVDQQAKASPGGKARARTARRVKGRFAPADAPGAPAPLAQQNDSAISDPAEPRQQGTSEVQQTPASGSGSGSDLSKTLPPARAIPRNEAPPKPAVPLEADTPERVEARRTLGTQVWNVHASLFAKLQANGISPDAQAPSVHDAGRTELAHRIREWDQEGGIQLAWKRCQHVLAIGEAEARAKRTLRYFGGRLWQPNQVSNALPMSTSDVTAAGAPAGRAGPRRAQPRDASTGRVEPHQPHEYVAGEFNCSEIFKA